MLLTGDSRFVDRGVGWVYAPRKSQWARCHNARRIEVAAKAPENAPISGCFGAAEWHVDPLKFFENGL